MNSLPHLEPFDCEGDPLSVGSRWEKWKRGLETYLVAADIEQPTKKRATLLHMGGISFQDIYYNIPGAHIQSTENEDTDIYKVAITKLDDYFSPKQSTRYERHLFRLMKQEPNEKFEKFLIRLRKQASKCNFKCTDENIIDQIIEKCSSDDLRKKILKAGDEFTLQEIIIEANTLESVNRQLEEFGDKSLMDGQPTSVNKIHTNFTRRATLQNSAPTKVMKCTRCGLSHRDAQECKAVTLTCLKCGIRGHFARVCRWKNIRKRQANKPSEAWTTTKKPRNNEETQGTSKRAEEIDYVFHIDDDSTLQCSIGGVTTELLIDSGCKCNLITDRTWEMLKHNKVHVFNMVRSPDKTFYAYGSTDPLVVTGSFKANIQINDSKEIAIFYVIKDGTKDLLGKRTAMALGVLQIGIRAKANQTSPVNSVNDLDVFPKFKDVLVKVPIDEAVTPVCQPYRRIPIPLEDKVTKKLKELLDLDIIEEVSEPSPWVSPMVPILKENKDIRLCVDMRRANSAIIREKHPLPTMEQLMPQFRHAKVFSRLDIKNAFHQVEIDEESRDITTFITTKGMFRYKRLMFGISCAPEMFQKIMERMLIGCEGTVNFIDDIVVFGSSEEEHDRRLKRVLEVLEENNVLLNKDKCVYKVSKITFLGHELSPTGVRPLRNYIENVLNFRPPITIDELQSFLGLVTFVGKWIPNLATLTEPFRSLLRLKLPKHCNIQKYWSDGKEEAFKTLKTFLGNIKTLGYYDPQHRTQVIADASPVGLGAVLIQFNSLGPRIVAYGNKSLSDCEKRYCQTEKEALALVWAVEHFKMYLFGKDEFELVSDHKPLEVIFGKTSKPCARIERWVLRLQAFNYKVVYRPGKSNIADPLSRLCVSNGNTANSISDQVHINQVIEYSTPTALTLAEIKQASAHDNEITKVRKGLYHNTWDDDIKCYKVFETELCLEENILLRGSKIVIPQKLRRRVLEAAHEGHPGIVSMKQRLRTKVWWPKIDKDAENMVRNCRSCTLVSAPNPPNPMKRRELPTKPWVHVAADLLGPLPSGEYLFVIIDYYSRYKEIKVTKTITTFEIIKLLKEIFSRLGYPVTITADNGKQFVSAEFRSYLHECGIQLYSTIPYWPQQNGEVERQNRSILKRLRISQIEKKNWKEELHKYMMMYSSTPHATTGKTPSELFFNRQFRDKIPSSTDVENQQNDSEVRDRDHLHKEQGKNYSDRKRKATYSDMQVGDKVFVKNFIKDNKLTPNFSPVPHTVIQSDNQGDIRVRNDETKHEYRRNVVHLKKVGGEWKVMNQNNEASSNESHNEGEDENEDNSSEEIRMVVLE